MNSDYPKLVFVSGVFNIIHPGHFRFLSFAKSQGDRLMVGLLPDAELTETSVSQSERLKNILMLNIVDDAFIIDKSIAQVIQEVTPAVVVKGWEHRERFNVEQGFLESSGGKLVFSQDNIKLDDITVKNGSNVNLNLNSTPFEEFSERRSITTSDLSKIVQKFEDLKVCVVGDLIVDQYVNCSPVGMSREDPTIVVRPRDSEIYVGGAGIVARHARALGAQVNFLSVAGCDKLHELTKDTLVAEDIDCLIVEDSTRPTIQKKRYRASGKTMLRVNEFSDHSISKHIEDLLLEEFQRLSDKIDLLVFSDFNYGLISCSFVQAIQRAVSNSELVVAADSQSSSQIGNLAKFQNISLATPTEYEARLTLNDFESGLVALSNKVRSKLSCDHLLLTLADEGVLITTGDDPHNLHAFENDQLPALHNSPVDVAGAGDAFLVTSGMALAAAGTIWEASYLGSIAAGIQVSRAGNIPIATKELLKAIKN